MRLPQQAGPVNLRKLFFMPDSPCQGEPFHGTQDMQSLIHRTLDSPPFCAPATWSIAQGIFL